MTMNPYPAARDSEVQAWAEATKSPVQGDHWNRQLLGMLDIPGLSPNQVRQCHDLVAQAEREENEFVEDGFILGSHEVGAKDRDLASRLDESLGDLDTLSAGLRDGSIGAEDAIRILRELTKQAQQYDGVIDSLEREYGRLLEMRENPQAYLDRLYAKSPSLAERRKRFI